MEADGSTTPGQSKLYAKVDQLTKPLELVLVGIQSQPQVLPTLKMLLRKRSEEETSLRRMKEMIERLKPIAMAIDLSRSKQEPIIQHSMTPLTWET